MFCHLRRSHVFTSGLVSSCSWGGRMASRWNSNLGGREVGPSAASIRALGFYLVYFFSARFTWSGESNLTLGTIFTYKDVAEHQTWVWVPSRISRRPQQQHMAKLRRPGTSSRRATSAGAIDCATRTAGTRPRMIRVKRQNSPAPGKSVRGKQTNKKRIDGA